MHIVSRTEASGVYYKLKRCLIARIMWRGGGGGKLFSFNEKRETPQLTQDLKYYFLYSFKDYL